MKQQILTNKLKGEIMKSQKLFSTLCAVILFVFASNSFAQTTTTTVVTTPSKTYKVTKEVFPQWSIAPVGGVIFPVMNLSETFKPNGAFGLDVGAKVNKEVGFYLRGGYYFMNSSASGAPVGKFVEITAGPRYYFSSINVKSQLFVDAGVGPYIFSRASYVDPNDPAQTVIPAIDETKLGINAGIGASVYLSPNMNLMVRTKYNTVFTATTTKSFITASTGLEFKF